MKAATNPLFQRKVAVTLAAFALTAMLSQGAHAERYALLVGVGAYKSISTLDGPPNDVSALRKVLIDRWQFDQDKVTSLVNEAATKKKILSELNRLAARVTADDELLIYFSGHGTSRYDAKHGFPMAHTTGGLVPYDFTSGANDAEAMSSLIVGNRDLRPVFLELDRRGVRTIYLADACYSSNSSRSVFSSNEYTRRQIPWPDTGGPVKFDEDLGEFKVEQDNYPYKRVVTFAAAGAHETAADIDQRIIRQYPTVDGQPHGAFTDALLRALNGSLPVDANHDGVAQIDEIFNSVRDFMAERAYPHTPKSFPLLENDTEHRRQQPLFRRVSVVQVERPAQSRLRVEAKDPALRAAIAKMDGVELSQGEGDLVVRGSDNSALCRKGTMIVTSTGDLDSCQLDGQAESVLARLRQLVWLRSLTVPAEGARMNVSIELADHARSNTVVEDEKLRMTMAADKSAQLLVLDVSPDGKINLIYPFRTTERQILPAGKPLSFPPLEDKNPIRVCGPFGREHVIVAAFPQESKDLKEWLDQSFVRNNESVLPDSFGFLAIQQIVSAKDTARSVMQLTSVGRSGKC